MTYITRQILTESGVAGADRVKSRQDFAQFLKSYEDVLNKFPGFVSLQPSGSYNSDPSKMDFGDIDLIVHIQSDKDKATIKKELQAFFTKMPETIIVPFSSPKHIGKRTYNAGELVSVRYHDDTLGYSAQIDNIVALDQGEASFKRQFLDMPAEKQGLILGLVKIATIETDPQILFKKLGITAPSELQSNQEYEFNLSSVEIQLRLVTYKPGTYEQLSREVIWSSKNFDDLQKILYQYDLNTGFDELLAQSKKVIKNPRSNNRMQGVFGSMITVKSGEVGTAKGAGKEAALAKIQQTFKESKSIFRALMEVDSSKKIVMAFGRFQPPTIGHELLINKVKQTAAELSVPYVIYVSKKQGVRPAERKVNPLSIDQKMSYLTKMFPNTNFVACDDTIKTPIEATTHLNSKYNQLVMVAGEDRVPQFISLLNAYNGKDYNYDSINVISSGDRDPDSDEVSGVSGTKMREYAVLGDFDSFRKGVPAGLNDTDARQLMQDIVQGIGVTTKKGQPSAKSAPEVESVAVEPDPTGYQKDLLTTPKNSLVIDTPGDLDWYKIGQHYPTLGTDDPHEYGQGDSDMVIVPYSKEELIDLKKKLDRLKMRYKEIGGGHEQPEIHDKVEETDKIKGADGKACWKGKRYAGTKNGKDKCIPISESAEKIITSLINKIISNEAI